MTSKAFMIGTSLLIGALTTAIGFYLYSHAQEPISPPSALDIDFEGDLPPTGTSLRVGSGSVLPQIVTAPTPEPDRSRGASNAGSDPAPGGAHPTVFASSTKEHPASRLQARKKTRQNVWGKIRTRGCL
ncbi:hypothetical protein I350_07982 [Cryptococcus amylolentus CBS 6273]|uniref:Uncharacterized protein n=1 Tax=Cryptococcus amylolentus CBS 6273 TaxID=1296118 RepID=A0A1E3J827_9TREE|nr:hypothetical protein I350_07982 [Cryptococcus amylolentus CBS 6273]